MLHSRILTTQLPLTQQPVPHLGCHVVWVLPPEVCDTLCVWSNPTLLPAGPVRSVNSAKQLGLGKVPRVSSILLKMLCTALHNLLVRQQRPQDSALCLAASNASAASILPVEYSLYGLELHLHHFLTATWWMDTSL